MTRFLSGLLATVCAISASVGPGWADTSTPTAGSARTSSTMLPKSIAGFCAGVIVGTPICFVRKLSQETVTGAHGMVGDTKNKLLTVPAGLLWMPFAGITSAVESPAIAWRNAWTADEPFSKEQFSLGDMDSSGKK